MEEIRPMTNTDIEPLLRTARRYVDYSLVNEASADELRWLTEHPRLWLRALVQVKFEVQGHIAKDKRSISSMKPPAGMHADAAYTEAKRAVDQRTQHRIHVQQLVQRQIEDVKSLFGDQSLDHMILGDLVEILTEIAEKIEQGDSKGALAKANYWANRIDEEVF